MRQVKIEEGLTKIQEDIKSGDVAMCGKTLVAEQKEKRMRKKLEGEFEKAF